MGTLLFERIVSLDVDKTYSELKNQLFREKSKLVIDEPSKFLVVEQGSLMGMTPNGAKKRIEYHFHPQGENQTRVIAKSSMASDWVKISAVSYLFVGLLVGISLFLAYDYENAIAIKRSSIFNNIAEAFGLINYSQSFFIIDMLKLLAIALSALVLISLIADLVIYKRRYSLVEETLRVLP